MKLPYRLTLLSMAIAGFTQLSAADYVSDVWCADLGNGKYINPIIDADYSDPDVVRVGDDYYMTASSFSDIPGLPVLHSKDLVNWTIIGHAIAEMPDYAKFATPN
ncbi:MAG: family 43 glycosylhydrolase, partial [Duncaniella sp.]|nr:family 43 glycosylhydrolase [Duncaniella sp.]